MITSAGNTVVTISVYLVSENQRAIVCYLARINRPPALEIIVECGRSTNILGEGNGEFAYGSLTSSSTSFLQDCEDTTRLMG